MEERKSSRPDEEVRIALMGACGVGKSWIMHQFLFGDPSSVEYSPTVEDSYGKTVEIGNSKVLVDLLDTAGTDEYQSLLFEWVNQRRNQGYLLVYSPDKEHSVDYVISTAEKICRQLSRPLTDLPLVVAATKSDLYPDDNVNYDLISDNAQGTLFIRDTPQERLLAHYTKLLCDIVASLPKDVVGVVLSYLQFRPTSVHHIKAYEWCRDVAKCPFHIITSKEKHGPEHACHSLLVRTRHLFPSAGSPPLFLSAGSGTGAATGSGAGAGAASNVGRSSPAHPKTKKTKRKSKKDKADDAEDDEESSSNDHTKGQCVVQ